MKGLFHYEIASYSVVSNSLQSQWTGALQSPLSMDFLGKITGVSSHSLLQGAFLTEGLSPSLLHCRHILYHLSHQGIPYEHKKKFFF